MENHSSIQLPLAYSIQPENLIRSLQQHLLSTEKESLYLCSLIGIGKHCPGVAEQLQEWIDQRSFSLFSLTGLVLN